MFKKHKIPVAAVTPSPEFFVLGSFLLRRNAMDVNGNITPPPPTSSGGGSGGGAGGGLEKGSLKERMVRARVQLDDLVEQTAEQFRKMTVSSLCWTSWVLRSVNVSCRT